MIIKVVFHLLICCAIGYFIWDIFPVVTQAVQKISLAWFQRRAEKLCREQWPETLLMMAAALKAGLTLDEAFDVMVKESSTPLRQLLQHRLQKGGQWMSLTERAGFIFSESYLSVLKRSFILASQTGASYVPILQSQAQILRKKQMMLRKIGALTAQSQMTAWIVGLSPAVLGFILWTCAPEFIQPFFQSPLGFIFLGGALTCNGIGFFVIRRMLAIHE